MSPPPYRVLRHRDLRLIWLSQLVSQTGSQMQTVSVNMVLFMGGPQLGGTVLLA